MTSASAFDRVLTRAVSAPGPAIHAHVTAARDRLGSDAAVADHLEQIFLTAVTATGAATGAAAALPGVGTVAAACLVGADLATFVASSAAFTLAMADLQDIPLTDPQRRATLVVTSLLGAHGVQLLADTTQVGLAQAGRTLMTVMPAAKVAAARGVLTRRLARKRLAQAGGGLVGRLVPFGIGAGIGAWAARGLGRAVVAGARAACAVPASGA